MDHPPVVVGDAQNEHITRQLAEAMERDMQAQRPLIEARQEGATSAVYWAWIEADGRKTD